MKIILTLTIIMSSMALAAEYNTDRYAGIECLYKTHKKGIEKSTPMKRSLLFNGFANYFISWPEKRQYFSMRVNEKELRSYGITRAEVVGADSEGVFRDSLNIILGREYLGIARSDGTSDVIVCNF